MKKKSHVVMQTAVVQVETIPFALKSHLKIELGNLTAKGAIAPVTEPVDWVSSMAIATKKLGELCVCIDPAGATAAEQIITEITLPSPDTRRCTLTKQGSSQRWFMYLVTGT